VEVFQPPPLKKRLKKSSADAPHSLTAAAAAPTAAVSIRDELARLCGYSGDAVDTAPEEAPAAERCATALPPQVRTR
jgi:hypothetical protein